MIDFAKNNNPKMYILAGPNGSGKSSVLFNKIPVDTLSLNADELSRKIAKARGIAEHEVQFAVNNSKILQIAGMKELVVLMQKAIQQSQSFATETSLDTKGYERYITSAKLRGFEIELLYVGTASAIVNINRVAVRAAKGGHDVPQETIAKRYHGSLERLSSYIQMVDRVEIHDNSKKPRHILTFNHGKIAEIAENVPDWVNENVLEKLAPKNILSVGGSSYLVELKREDKFVVASIEIDDTEVIVAITNKGELDKERSMLIDQYDHSDCDEINFKLQIIAEKHLKSLEATKAAEATREIPADTPASLDEEATPILQVPTSTPKKVAPPQKKAPARDSGRGGR